MSYAYRPRRRPRIKNKGQPGSIPGDLPLDLDVKQAVFLMARLDSPKWNELPVTHRLQSDLGWHYVVWRKSWREGKELEELPLKINPHEFRFIHTLVLTSKCLDSQPVFQLN